MTDPRLRNGGGEAYQLDRASRDLGRVVQRRQRGVLNALRAKEVTLAEVLELDVREVRLMRVVAVCSAWSGQTRQHCELVLWNNLGIRHRRIGGLGPAQRRQIVERFR